MAPWKIIPTCNCYFVTTTTVRWQPALAAKVRRRLIINSLKYCLINKGLHLHGYVIMPTHAPYIFSTDSGVCLSNVMRDFNTHTSREISVSLIDEKKERMTHVFREAARRAERGNSFKVWQAGYHRVSLETDRFFKQKLKYIHNNPVKAGLVEWAEDWEYSSARNYTFGDHLIIRVEFVDWSDRRKTWDE